MQRDEKLIWDYLDGSLNDKQSANFKLRLESDSDLMNHYKQQLKLHNSLKELEISAAPDFLLSNVMVGIKNEAILQPKTTNFTGIKYILLIFVALTTSLLGLGIMTPSQVEANQSFGEKLNGVLEPLSFLDSVSSIGLPNQTILMCGIATGLLLVMFWADEMFNKIRVVKRRN